MTFCELLHLSVEQHVTTVETLKILVDNAVHANEHDRVLIVIPKAVDTVFYKTK